MLGLGVPLLVVGFISLSTMKERMREGEHDMRYGSDRAKEGRVMAVAVPLACVLVLGIPGLVLTIGGLAQTIMGMQRSIEEAGPKAGGAPAAPATPPAAPLSQELARLKGLHDQGALSDDEYAEAKQRVLRQ